MKEFFKMLKNYRWKVRFENLEKKYNELIKENADLKRKLESDYSTKLIRNKERMIKRQKEIIKNLQEDYKKVTSNKGE